MISLAEINSRMKDFYDVFFLSQNEAFTGNLLQEAIISTFSRRNTPFTAQPLIFTSSFHEDPKRIELWKIFLKRLNSKEIDFKMVMQSIYDFIHPLYESILKNEVFIGQWNHNALHWK